MSDMNGIIEAEKQKNYAKKELALDEMITLDEKTLTES